MGAGADPRVPSPVAPGQGPGWAKVATAVEAEMPPADFDLAKVPTVERARLQSANAQAKFDRGKRLHDQQPPLMSDQD